jgi:hypothetical protein
LALSSVPFALQNQPHNADVFRQAVSSLVQDTGGVVEAGDFGVTQTGTPSLAVSVAAGRLWLPGNNLGLVSGEPFSKQAMYFVLNDGPVIVPISTPNSLNPRIDVIYIQTPDTFYSMASDVPVLNVLVGTPSATPVVPTNLPNNATALANVAVAANAPSISNANITARALAVVGPYTNPGWVTFPLSSGWTNYVGGGAYPTTLQGRILPGGMVNVQGMVKGGAAGSVIAALPAAFQPQSTFLAPCTAAAGAVVVQVAANTGSQSYSLNYQTGAAAPAYLNINLTYSVI